MQRYKSIFQEKRLKDLRIELETGFGFKKLKPYKEDGIIYNFGVPCQESELQSIFIEISDMIRQKFTTIFPPKNNRFNSYGFSVDEFEGRSRYHYGFYWSLHTQTLYFIDKGKMH